MNVVEQGELRLSKRPVRGSSGPDSGSTNRPSNGPGSGHDGGAKRDQDRGQVYDGIARILRAVCGTPEAGVMLRRRGGHWTRISGGRQRPREGAPSDLLCQRVLTHGALLVMPEVDPDERWFLSSPKEPIRFFAALPVRALGGDIQALLSTTDRVPRELTREQEDAFSLLGRQLKAALESEEQRTLIDLLFREREISAAKLRASDDLFRAFMDASPFVSYIKDAAGRLLFYNRAFARHFGVSERAWLGRADSPGWKQNGISHRGIEDHEVIAGDRIVESEASMRDIGGRESAWKIFRFPCHDSAGNSMVAGVAVDMTEEIARKLELERCQAEMTLVNEQLRQLSVTDALTGLRNRRSFEERLAMEFSVARRRKRQLAVLLLDIDNFKRINDQRGHAAGDEVLRQLSMILRSTVRLPDMVARYGGEEFVVLLPESDAKGALGFARRLMDRMRKEIWDEEPVTISIGVGTLAPELTEGSEMVQRADEALYTAKRTGKNRVVVYEGGAGAESA